jgi:hypothetical protein
MRIRVSVQTNHFFGNTNTQKTVAKEKSLCTEEKPSFVYLCIGVSGQRNHSLRPRCILFLIIFLSFNSPNGTKRQHPPHVPPRSRLLYNIPQTTNANYRLVVVSPHPVAAI